MKADGVLESLQRPALDMAAPERDVEAPERRFRVDALQVVALAEQRLVAASHGGLRIALSARDGAKAVKPSRDGGDDPKRIEVGTTGDAWESILAKPRQTSFLDQIISRVRGWCQV